MSIMYNFNLTSDLQLSSGSFGAATYVTEVEFLEALTESRVVIFRNNGPLNEYESFRVATSMLLHKPIIMTAAPTFSNNVNVIYKNLILGKLSKIFVLNLDALDIADKDTFLKDLDKVNYILTKKDVIFLRLLRQQYFRRLEFFN